METAKEKKEAHDFTRAVCLGNKDAENFCNLYFVYCHGIDDLLDTMVDGRPTMGKEEILGLFANAAMLYNCNFYKQHSATLFSIILTVTNAYADSVAWERDPKEHRRTIADVLRTCGNELFFMVAMICGGWAHMRKVSGAIRERDYLLQHTKPDDFF
jgi:hypothetical protein